MQWIDRFGERLYMQYPEEGVLYQDADVENWYGWLIQFTDGNRLDLHVGTAERAGKNLELYRVLVDKDGLFVKKEESSDERYWIRRPGEREYLDVCNEFWWCLNNVAKGLWRGDGPGGWRISGILLQSAGSPWKQTVPGIRARTAGERF